MTDDASNIEVRSSVICDQIRREDNGKSILIGVYAGDLIANILPAVTILSFWVLTHADKAGPMAIEFRVLGVNGDLLAEFVVQGEYAAKGFGSIPSPALPLQLAGPGWLKFEWRPKGTDDWRQFAELEIRKAASSTS